MGQNESNTSRDITCDIPILQSCYSYQKKNQSDQRQGVTETKLRYSLMSGVVRKAYAKINKINQTNQSKVLSSSRNLQTVRDEQKKESTEQLTKFKHQQHFNLYQQQQEQLRRFVQGEKGQEVFIFSPNYKQNQRQGTRQSIKSFESEVQQSQRLMSSVRMEPTYSQRIPLSSFDFERLLFSVPNEALFHILSFMLADYCNLIQVSSLWYLKIHQAVDSFLVQIDNKFIRSYLQTLSFKNGYSSYSNFKLSQQIGFRLDRNIIAELLPEVENKIVTIGYEFNYKGDKQRKKYSFKFMGLRKGQQRTMWISMDECTNNYDKNKQATIQPILPFCIGDSIKLAINIFNLYGTVDMNTLVFTKPILEPINQGSIFSQTKHMRVPTSLEPLEADWVLYDYYDDPNKIILDLFQPQLQLKECRCRGFGVVVSKMTYLAVCQGSIDRMSKQLNLNVIVKTQNQEITNEVKRTGLVHDLENTLEMMVGDKLILYYIKGGDDI